MPPSNAKRARCPSCKSAMDQQVLPGVNAVNGGIVELDICFSCQGIWFDPQENLKLSPAAVAELFKCLYEHRDDIRQPLAEKLQCPHCNNGLAQGFDVVRSGRYITYRCGIGHGRFSAFSSFMIEKGFVRQLTGAEVNDLAQRIQVIHCSGCGAPVDLRKDHACPQCRSAFSLLDPSAVERALQGYAKAAAAPTGPRAPDLADALVTLERDRQRTLRERQTHRTGVLTADANDGIDLWAIGIALVANLLDD